MNSNLDTQKNKQMIDIIVTHYDEPWEVGKKLFHMFSLQRGIRFSDFRVIIVQDGEEHGLDWDSLFQTCPYQVDILTIPHAGMSAARNAGIKAATADWVMFCDFDDMFADVYSMKMYLNVLPTEGADILWVNCYREELRRGNSFFVNMLEEDFTHTFGKLFNRKWMMEHHISFCEKLQYMQETAFCGLCLAETNASRIMRIKTSFTMFLKTLRKDGYNQRRSAVADRIESVFYADQYLIRELEKRGNMSEMRMTLACSVIDMYYLLNSEPVTPHHAEIRNKFIELYARYKKEFEKIRPIDMEVAYNSAQGKMLAIVQGLYNDHLIEAEPPEDGIKYIKAWLKKLDGEIAMSGHAEYEDDITVSDTPAPISLPAPIVDRDARVVVYTGTRNVYEDMISSLKSLLATTYIDHAYLMIEDDEFPYPLPDYVTTINVKNQEYFDKNGPNYNNVWSYMCMMRAAFPEMFPNLSKVLSLDIDIVVTKDIGDLWDIDLSDYYYAGCPEPERQDKTTGNIYTNFGVILMNLDKMREDGIGEKTIHALNTCRLGCPEQDAFNRTCAGKIYPIPVEYNYNPYTHLTGETNDESVIHYAGMRYWKHFDNVRKFSRMTWEEINQNRVTLMNKKKLTQNQQNQQNQNPQ